LKPPLSTTAAKSVFGFDLRPLWNIIIRHNWWSVHGNRDRRRQDAMRERPKRMSATGRFLSSLAMVALAITLAPAARAAQSPEGFEFAPVVEVPETGDATRLRTMFGLRMGYDSNPGRADDAARDSDGTATVAGGLALIGGNSRFRFSAATEARARRFFDRNVLDFEELVVRGTAVLATQRVRLGLRASHALRADPVDVDELFFPVLERTETVLAPKAEFTMGGAVLGIGYRSAIADYDKATLGYLDHTDSSASLDLSWGRAGASRYFLRFETGGVDFDAFDPVHPRVDFDRDRFYAGLRTPPQSRQSLELGLGYFGVDGAPSGDDEGLYATVRTTRLFGEGSSALELAYVRDAEASATAEFKTASRVVVRYARKVNMLWNWSAGYRAQFADLVGPDLPAEDSIAFHALDFGVGRALGSPGRWRGRLHAGTRMEFGDDFDRVVLTVGAELVR